jgi:FAD/FMN-containing dehydrogenase
MKSVAIDVEGRTGRFGAGLNWGELDAATQEHGLAVTGGRLSGLGVAGVALGDGSGWLERALGPTAASLVGAEVVLADGRVVEAGTDAELLWALRGAGAGLGVVTRLDLRLHPVGPHLVSGFLGFPRERAAAVARAYREHMAQAPDQVGGGLLLGAGLGGVCTIVFCHLGSVADGEEGVAPLRDPRPSLDAVAPNPYLAFERIWDAGNPAGTRVHMRRAFLRELPDDCIDAVVARANLPAATLSYVFLRPLGGALSPGRVNGTALALPDAGWACECVGLWPPVPALDRGQVAWVDGLAQAVEPFSLAAAGRDTSERWLAIKRRCDPGGAFVRSPD